MSTPFRLGIAGLGTVGAGVVKIVQAHGAMLAEKAGRPVEITAVSARNRGLDRGVDLSAYVWEDDATRLAHRDDVDCVIEVIGGSDGPAKALVSQALAAGKHVITANKALIATHGAQLLALARSRGLHLRFEASVCGAIPVIKVIRESLIANRIRSLTGIVNGTTSVTMPAAFSTTRASMEVTRPATATAARRPYLRLSRATS